MNRRLLTVAGCLAGAAVVAHAQTPAATTPPTVVNAAQTPIACQGSPTPPPTPPAVAAGVVAGQGRGGGRAGGQGQGQGQPAERLPYVTAIAGVVAEGVPVTPVYSTFGANADGVIALEDGDILINQEENNAVIRIAKDDRASIFLADTGGSGALSRDRQGRIFAVIRMPTANSIGAARPNAPKTAGISMLWPERKIVADTFSDGTKWTGRPNDLTVDASGGAYFTQGCLYYASASGTISLVGENVNANGIVLSLDDTQLFVTNGGAGGANATVLAFDVTGPGRLSNRRVFATLGVAGGADAMTVDTMGRLYVASTPGVQVFGPAGQYLGLIPTPRNATGEAFGGADRRTLYVVTNGASDATGQPIAGRTVYKIPMVAQGMAGRSK